MGGLLIYTGRPHFSELKSTILDCVIRGGTVFWVPKTPRSNGRTTFWAGDSVSSPSAPLSLLCEVHVSEAFGGEQNPPQNGPRLMNLEQCATLADTESVHQDIADDASTISDHLSTTASAEITALDAEITECCSVGELSPERISFEDISADCSGDSFSNASIHDADHDVQAMNERSRGDLCAWQNNSKSNLERTSRCNSAADRNCSTIQDLCEDAASPLQEESCKLVSVPSSKIQSIPDAAIEHEGQASLSETPDRGKSPADHGENNLRARAPLRPHAPLDGRASTAAKKGSAMFRSNMYKAPLPGSAGFVKTRILALDHSRSLQGATGNLQRTTLEKVELITQDESQDLSTTLGSCEFFRMETDRNDMCQMETGAENISQELKTGCQFHRLCTDPLLPGTDNVEDDYFHAGH